MFIELPISVDDIESSNMPNEVVLHGMLCRTIDGITYSIYAVLTKNNFRAYHLDNIQQLQNPLQVGSTPWFCFNKNKLNSVEASLTIPFGINILLFNKLPKNRSKSPEKQ